jgi:nitrogen regulatory protein PII-like uncharacterized protein
MTGKKYTKVKDNVFTTKENFVKKAKDFYVAVAVDKDGSEGVIAMVDFNRFPPMEKPLMGASEEDRDAIMKAAKDASENAVMKIRVLKYTQVEVYAEFIPKKLN